MGLYPIVIVRIGRLYSERTDVSTSWNVTRGRGHGVACMNAACLSLVSPAGSRSFHETAFHVHNPFTAS